jgi:hypothetical protein
MSGRRERIMFPLPYTKEQQAQDIEQGDLDKARVMNNMRLIDPANVGGLQPQQFRQAGVYQTVNPQGSGLPRLYRPRNPRKKKNYHGVPQVPEYDGIQPVTLLVIPSVTPGQMTKRHRNESEELDDLFGSGKKTRSVSVSDSGIPKPRKGEVEQLFGGRYVDQDKEVSGRSGEEYKPMNEIDLLFGTKKERKEEYPRSSENLLGDKYYSNSEIDTEITPLPKRSKKSVGEGIMSGQKVKKPKGTPLWKLFFE